MQLSRVKINTILLVGSSLLTKAVLFLLYIYVARVLGPSNYGLVTSSTEYVGLFLIIATFGFQMASIREYKKAINNDFHIFNKILPIRIIFGVVSFCLCLIIASILYLNTKNFELILILSIMVIFEPFENHLYTIFWANEELKYPALGEVVKVLVYTIFFIILNSIFGLSVFNLVIASLSGYLSSLSIKYFFIRKRHSYKLSLEWDSKFIRRFLNQSFYFGVVSILYICSLRVDIQMINILSGNKEVGYYSVSWQIVQIGIVFVQALSTSLFPNSMANMHRESYRKSLKKKMNRLVLLVILGCIFASIIAPYVLTFIYGEKYRPAGIILSLLIWYIPMRLYSIVGSQILESGSWYKKRVYIYALPLVLNIILNLYIIPVWGAYGAAITALISNTFLVILIYLHSYLYEKKFY